MKDLVKIKDVYGAVDVIDTLQLRIGRYKAFPYSIHGIISLIRAYSVQKY